MIIPRKGRQATTGVFYLELILYLCFNPIHLEVELIVRPGLGYMPAGFFSF